MSDRVSQMFWSASARSLRGLKEFIEVYIDKPSVFIIVYFVVSPKSAPHSKAPAILEKVHSFLYLKNWFKKSKKKFQFWTKKFILKGKRKKQVQSYLAFSKNFTFYHCYIITSWAGIHKDNLTIIFKI
jgi:hypothetical protein